MTDEELLREEWDRVVQEYDHARELLSNTPRDSSIYRVVRTRWTNAQQALSSTRAAWRAIGEAVSMTDPQHPGARTIVRIANHEADDSRATEIVTPLGTWGAPRDYVSSPSTSVNVEEVAAGQQVVEVPATEEKP